jgi:hypothetical protein
MCYFHHEDIQKITKGNSRRLATVVDKRVLMVENIILVSLTISFTAAGNLSAGKSGNPREKDSGDSNE